MNISVVCVANHCRSPVAEVILKNNPNISKDINITSYGLNPLLSTDMDKRSLNFLRLNNYDFKHHTPRKITKTNIKNSSLVLALDFNILHALNKLYPNYADKFKLLTFMSSKKQIIDPYRMNDKEYENIMREIEKASLDIILDESIF